MGPGAGLGSKCRCARGLQPAASAAVWGQGSETRDITEFWGNSEAGKGVGRPSLYCPLSGTWEGRARTVQGHTKQCLPLPVLGTGRAQIDTQKASL